MEPDLQKLAVTALVGLALFFPVFNQVAATSLDALTNADHQAKWKNFLKGWDDIPEDEKLAYWDGRTTPPGDGNFDEDRIDDDARFRQPAPQPRPGDRDGDGVPDESDVDPDDPEEQGERRFVWVTELLWQCPCNNQGGPSNNEVGDALNVNGRVYQFVNASIEYRQFAGNYEVNLATDGESLWSSSSSGLMLLPQDRPLESDTNPEVSVPMTITYDYDPLGGQQPVKFEVIITGAYREYIDEA